VRNLLPALMLLGVAMVGCVEERFSDPGSCLVDSTDPECMPRPEEGVTLSIITHCGLSYPRIWMNDEPHRLDVPATEINQPMGWNSPQDVTIKEEDGQYILYGPWFSRIVLVPDPGAELDGCM
jgi:hypothetical protein